MDNIQFSNEQVLKQLESLDIRVPTQFLQYLKKKLRKTYSLQIIFNRSLSEGIFPDTWKQANVTSVCKSVPKDDVENYRLILILSAMSKVFEGLVHSELNPLIHSAIAP